MEEPSWLEKVRGYLDLGMIDEAASEIEKLPLNRRNTEATQEMRIVIQLDRGDLKSAFALCETLCDIAPENHAGFIQGAYCLHELERTEDAIEHLQSGPQTLRDEPVYFYNLGCYELAMGRDQAAVTWLEQSFEMDPAHRKKAVQDPDLESVRHLFSK